MRFNQAIVPVILASVLSTGCGSDATTELPPPPPSNSAPEITVNDVTADEQTTIELSADVTDDGTIASYLWQQTGGVEVEIEDADKATASFVAPTILVSDGPQTLTFSLTAKDNKNAETTATLNVVINPVNQSPIAAIVAPENGNSFGDLETLLDAMNSSDADGEIVSYQWQQVSGDAVTVDSLEQAQLRYKGANKTGELSFELTVTDNEGATATASVTMSHQPYYLQVSAGERHHCTLTQDNSGNGVYCWGAHNSSVNEVPDLVNPTAIGSSQYSNCAIDEGTLKCWGSGANGMFDFPQLSNVSQFGFGMFHMCALDENGVSCWGSNNSNQLDVPELSNPVKLVVGNNNNCALDDNGVTCWGKETSSVMNVPEMSGVTDLFGGLNDVCALHETGLLCWGHNGAGEVISLQQDPATIAEVSISIDHTCIINQLEAGQKQVVCFGEEGNPATRITELVPAYDDPRSLTSGIGHSCAIDNRGIRCFGTFNGSKFVGQTDAPAFDAIELMTSGYAHSCAVGTRDENSGVLECWGMDTYDNTQAPAMTGVTYLSANDNSSCAIGDNGARCWGAEPNDIANPPFFEPIATSDDLYIPDVQNIVAVEPGYQSNCVLGDSGVSCWGDFWFGQQDVPHLTNPTALASGDSFHCAVADEGLQCWGSIWGSPFEVPTPELSQVSMISAEDFYACALSEGKVHCWGASAYGLFDIPELVNPVKVVAGPSNACAIDDTGLVCWGRNHRGQLRMPELTNPKDMTIGDGYICATDDNGIQCWGWEGFGDNPIPTREEVMATKKAVKAPVLPEAAKTFKKPVKS